MYTQGDSLFVILSVGKNLEKLQLDSSSLAFLKMTEGKRFFFTCVPQNDREKQNVILSVAKNLRQTLHFGGHGFNSIVF